MSFGQYRVLSLTIPSVAAFAVISILWFRHLQRKRRPRIDKSQASVTKHPLQLLTEGLGNQPELEVARKEVVSSAALPIAKETEARVVEKVTACEAPVERERVELPCSTQGVTLATGEVGSMEEEACRASPQPPEARDSLSDLEEGEIRSPDQSFLHKVHFKESDERDSVFDSDEKKGEESDLEEGEIRSVDGQEEVKKREGEGYIKEELAEKLASLALTEVAGEPKSLASLDLDEGKSGSERDSANHSPSEVMLASPSISNFSDAHSEGSSDSGKGQSDGATSPSRTPAGGSSLAGDQAPSVYEFILPQVIVGRLIGRHGTFLHEIKTQTHTNIFIKRHPDSDKLKICAIEGSQQDIEKALAKIRQKFPLRRFPQLTLEKVSFVHLNSLPPLKPEDFHLQLIEGVNNDVVLSSLVSAAHFFLQQPCHPSYASLAALNSIMSQLYSSGEAPPLETPVNYAVCAAPAMGGWYRAQIVGVDEESDTCTVRYLDYGGYSQLPTGLLRQIRGDLLALPFQATECYLACVQPPPGEDDWSEEARLFVQSLTCGQVLQAQVYDYAEDGSPLVYLYTKFANQVVLVNEELVIHGYGVIADSPKGSSSCASEDGRTDDELALPQSSSLRPERAQARPQLKAQ